MPGPTGRPRDLRRDLPRDDTFTTHTLSGSDPSIGPVHGAGSRLALGVAAVVAVSVLPFAATPASAVRNQDGGSLQQLQRQRDAGPPEEGLAGLAGERAAGLRRRGQRSAVDVVVERERAAGPCRGGRARRRTGHRPSRRPPRPHRPQKQKELDEITAQMKESAVEAYVSMGSGDTFATLGADDINDAVNKRTLLSMRASKDIDLAERYRSVQEDLETQRATAAAAAERARSNQTAVEDRLDELNDAYARTAGVRCPGRAAPRLGARRGRLARHTRRRAVEVHRRQAGRAGQGRRGAAGGPDGPGQVHQLRRRCRHQGRQQRWWRWRRSCSEHRRQRFHRQRRRHPRAPVDRRRTCSDCSRLRRRRASTSVAAATATPPDRSPRGATTAARPTTPSTRCPRRRAALRRHGPAPRCTSVASPSTSPRAAPR